MRLCRGLNYWHLIAHIFDLGALNQSAHITSIMSMRYNNLNCILTYHSSLNQSNEAPLLIGLHCLRLDHHEHGGQMRCSCFHKTKAIKQITDIQGCGGCW